MECAMNGIKLIQIMARAIYPVVTAYEFEYLKTEKSVREWLRPCTIYFIVQRPLTYVTNVVDRDGILYFEIADDSATSTLKVALDPTASGYAEAEEELLIEYQFYRKTPDKAYPLRDVAAIKLLRKSGEFIVWLTAQKIIYQYLNGWPAAEIDGNIAEFIDYKVHYIGQAFSQDVWDRLTGHEKMQSILTLEDSFGEKYKKNSYEISLIMLSIMGYDEANVFPVQKNQSWLGAKPLLHKVRTKEEFERFNMPALAVDALELTNEIEAMLVSLFRPTYNTIKFEKYPYIKSGTRSAGYTEALLKVETLPAILYTDSHRQDLVLPVRA
jgi:hypothetical protein